MTDGQSHLINQLKKFKRQLIYSFNLQRGYHSLFTWSSWCLCQFVSFLLFITFATCLTTSFLLYKIKTILNDDFSFSLKFYFTMVSIAVASERSIVKNSFIIFMKWDELLWVMILLYVWWWWWVSADREESEWSEVG